MGRRVLFQSKYILPAPPSSTLFLLSFSQASMGPSVPLLYSWECISRQLDKCTFEQYFTILLELALVTVPPSLTGVYLGPGNAFNCPISFSILCAGKFSLSLVSPGCVWSIQRHTSLEECPLHVYLQLAHAFQLTTTQTLLPVPQSITCRTWYPCTTHWWS